MKRKSLGVVALVAALTLVLAACGSDSKSGTTTTTTGTSAAKTIKAAWLLVGPKNDGGWSQAQYDGIVAVQNALGNKVVTSYKENVPEGPEAKTVIEDLVKAGNKIIFGTSFGYAAALKAEAALHPDVDFEHATGEVTTKNLAIYYGAGEDGNYLAGMAAGAATKNGNIGFVAPFPIPEVIRHINAYTLGAQSMNPKAKVKVIWINGWFDPTKERAAAESLIQGGADVIASGGDSPAAGEAAKAANVDWTGYDSDQSKNFPSVWLTAATYNWGPYYVKRVTAALDGTWKTGSYYGNLGDGFVVLAPFGSRVDAATQTKINAKLAELKAKPDSEFTGPIKDQAGTLKVKAGETQSLGDLLSIDWFVQGVVGSPKG
jgi:basic membrane protein A